MVQFSVSGSSVEFLVPKPLKCRRVRRKWSGVLKGKVKIKIKKINDRDKNRLSKQEIKCECKSHGGKSFRSPNYI